MRRFLASAWFPFVTAILLAAATAGAYVWIKPSPDAIGNYEIARIAKIAAWGIGPLIGLLSLILAGILNLLRRLFRIRKVNFLHAPIVFFAILPWAIFAWELVMVEPRYTPIARAVIDFAGKEMFLGSVAAVLFTMLMFLVSLIPSRK